MPRRCLLPAAKSLTVPYTILVAQMAAQPSSRSLHTEEHMPSSLISCVILDFFPRHILRGINYANGGETEEKKIERKNLKRGILKCTPQYELNALNPIFLCQGWQKPGFFFFLKTQPSGFFWVFFGFYWVLLGFFGQFFF